MDLGFQVENNKVWLVRGENRKEYPRDAFLGVCQMVLSTVANGRDYTSITSVRKLLRTIDLECEPDESDDEHELPNKPVARAVVTKKPSTKESESGSEEESKAPKKPVRAAPARRAPVRKPVAKPTPAKDSDTDSDDSD